MTSKRQIGANRRNARRSTGPKSAAGKAASSANALRHGLCAAGTAVLPSEEADAFERLRRGVLADLGARGALQTALAQRIAVLLWRLERAARLEAEVFVHGDLSSRCDRVRRAPFKDLSPFSLLPSGPDGLTRSEAIDAIDDEILVRAPSAKVLVEHEDNAKAFDRLGRYEGTLQRALHRTLEEFRRLREASPAAAPDPGPEPAVGAPPRSEGADAPCEADAPADGADAPAGQAECGERGAGENGLLRNEANSTQPVEEADSSATVANPPETPPTDPPVP